MAATALRVIEGGGRPLRDAPTEGQVRELLSRVRDYFQDRQSVAREQRRLYLGDYEVPRPEGLRQWHVVRSTLPAQQAGLVKGILSPEMPTVEAFVASIGKRQKADAEHAEAALNHLFPRLEEQNGPEQQVWEPALNDLILVGGGVTRLRPMPARLVKGHPTLDYDDPKGYLTRRAQAVKAQGGWLGRLPLQWEWVLWERYWHFVDDETGGIEQSFELKTRRLSDLLRNPRYGKQLQRYVDRLKENERDLAESVLIDLWCIETDAYTAIVADGCTTQLASAASGGDHLYVSRALDSEMANGALLDVQPNPLGRSSYVVFPGLSMGSEDPAIKTFGINYLQRDLVRVLSQWYSIALSRAANWAAPPWIGSQQAVDLGGGVTGYAAQGPDGEEQRIELEPGKLTWLPPGTAVQEMVGANHSATEADILAQLRHEALMLGIPEGILDAGGGQSGYLNDQVVQTVLARYQPLVRNIKLAWQDQVAVALDCLRYLGEPLSVLVGTKEKSAEWYTLDPEILDAMELHLKVRFDLKKPQDVAANIQNAIAVTQAQMMSRETAMAEFIGISDVEREKELMLLEELESAPPLKQTLLADVLHDAGIEIQDQQADEQGDVTPADFDGMPPAGVQAFVAAATPGTPGWQTAQRLQGGAAPAPNGALPTPAGQGEAPQLPAAGGPAHTPGPVRGRAAGQKRRPGGARRRGGL